MDKIKVDSVLGVRNNYRICGGRIESGTDRNLKFNSTEVFLFLIFICTDLINITSTCNYLFALS